MDWNIIIAGATTVATIAAIIAIFQGISIHRQQQVLSKEIHEQQILLARRQLLLPLWDHLDGLADINSDDPVWEEVRNAANILELVAVSWEGQLIDEDIIRRIFSMTFVKTYDKIKQCTNAPINFPMDGPEMLRNSPSTTKLYQQLVTEHINHNKLTPL